LQTLRVQELIDDVIHTSGIVVQIDTVPSIWLNVRSEVTGGNIWEIALHHGLERGCDSAGVGTIVSAIWEISVCK
jgi:hypothetical protein